VSRAVDHRYPFPSFETDMKAPTLRPWAI
jgi:hypothetical protein